MNSTFAENAGEPKLSSCRSLPGIRKQSINKSHRTCLYRGTIRHRRHCPVGHEFRYQLYLVCIDLERIDDLFAVPLICSTNRFSLVQFRRSDYHGNPRLPLDQCIRSLVKQQLNLEVDGPILLLTHLRYFGIAFNPVSFYYCYDRSGERLEAIVAEVSNTPWRQRHCYVIPCKPENRVHRHCCRKDFHVSPFMPMEMFYHWKLTEPKDRLTVHIENHNSTGRVFDATLQLSRREFSPGRLLWSNFRFPLMTLQVLVLIYWQALRLWCKRLPLFSHPRRLQREA